MLKINLICVGGLKEPYEKAACAEYARRLSAFCTLNLTEIPAENVQGEGTADVARALHREAERIMPRLEGTVLALAPEGKTEDSAQFAARIKTAQDKGETLTFVIGGSHGLAEDVKRRAKALLSFSPMTFPHRLFRVMFLEQLYRGFAIIQGKTYHK